MPAANAPSNSFSFTAGLFGRTLPPTTLPLSEDGGKPLWCRRRARSTGFTQGWYDYLRWIYRRAAEKWKRRDDWDDRNHSGCDEALWGDADVETEACRLWHTDKLKYER